MPFIVLWYMYIVHIEMGLSKLAFELFGVLDSRIASTDLYSRRPLTKEEEILHTNLHFKLQIRIRVS